MHVSKRPRSASIFADQKKPVEPFHVKKMIRKEICFFLTLTQSPVNNDEVRKQLATTPRLDVVKLRDP